jgi:hypothetical protein
VFLAVVTAAVFPVLYVAGYTAGKRWPLRRKDSLEYRAHPRHQKRDRRAGAVTVPRGDRPT